MKPGRKGISLIEIMIAVVILGGPMIYCVSGVINATRSTGRHLDRASAQIMLTDFAEWVMAKSFVRPKMLVSIGKDELFDRWMDGQWNMEPTQREMFRKNLGELMARTTIEMVRAPEGRRGLCLVKIAATLADGTRLSVPVLLRGIPHWRKGKWRKPDGQPSGIRQSV